MKFTLNYNTHAIVQCTPVGIEEYTPWVVCAFQVYHHTLHLKLLHQLSFLKITLKKAEKSFKQKFYGGNCFAKYAHQQW